MLCKALALFALVAAVNGGHAVSYLADPHVGAQYESTVRGFGGLSSATTYSKAVDGAFSSVRKTDTRVTNDAVHAIAAPVALAAPVHHGFAHAAPLAHTYAAAPVAAVAHHGYAAAPVAAAPAFAHHGYAAAPIAHHGFAAAAPLAHTYAHAAPVAAVAHHGYAAPAVAHHGFAHAAPVAAVSHHYSAAPAVASYHFNGIGLGTYAY